MCKLNKVSWLSWVQLKAKTKSEAQFKSNKSFLLLWRRVLPSSKRGRRSSSKRLQNDKFTKAFWSIFAVPSIFVLRQSILETTLIWKFNECFNWPNKSVLRQMLLFIIVNWFHFQGLRPGVDFPIIWSICVLKTSYTWFWSRLKLCKKSLI